MYQHNLRYLLFRTIAVLVYSIINLADHIIENVYGLEISGISTIFCKYEFYIVDNLNIFNICMITIFSINLLYRLARKSNNKNEKTLLEKQPFVISCVVYIVVAISQSPSLELVPYVSQYGY